MSEPNDPRIHRLAVLVADATVNPDASSYAGDVWRSAYYRAASAIGSPEGCELLGVTRLPFSVAEVLCYLAVFVFGTAFGRIL